MFCRWAALFADEAPLALYTAPQLAGPTCLGLLASHDRGARARCWRGSAAGTQAAVLVVILGNVGDFSNGCGTAVCSSGQHL